MSIVSDDLFADKIKQLQALKNEINQDKDEVYKILGEWLANALADDNNYELQAIFLGAYDSTQYLKLKKRRELLVPIAQKLESKVKESGSKIKVTPSNFRPPQTSPNHQDSQDHLLFDGSVE